ncbi:(d)CMP kinase [Candidatus Acetothermia bacterium]|jgi:cytidylate kinase|nr:(d)CMP kinase [Candidatus Acetothermia bacterium]MCI2431911.1 (d)CMP kinase [Candidatus Acetothermia bacterium]MCI2437356.1 (d)CMP kinase [Candidatus Acetothermia bacterium]
MQIAIDGPAGAGKTSVARALAQHFQCLLVNTGAMYRAVALGLSQNLQLSDVHIDVLPRERLLLNGEDVTEQLYTPEMDELASQIAARPDVREVLIAKQRQIAQRQSVVMEGRDITTVVLPDADVKLFLEASVEARAQRRARERGEEYHSILEQIRERDQRDGQSFARLQITPKTIVLNTDHKSLDEVVALAIKAVQRALQGRNISGKLSQ